MSKPKVVCLCGSEKFVGHFSVANHKESMAGNIVVAPSFQESKVGDRVVYTPEERAKLDELHQGRMDMADEILVLNIEGYIGDSTKKEVAYARKAGKAIRWKEPHIRVDCLWSGDLIDGQPKK